ncbi:MAG: VWA domain-containing protein, partial [Anaerotignaceae bacterium]
KQAYDEIIKTDTKLKHIILLTDGQAEQTGYDSLIEQMKANGITLSTIAVGGGADTKLLSDLAQKANGRYYFTSEFSSLPEIFTKETTLAGKEYLNNREFYPVGSNSPILTGIEQIAPLKGYVGTTIKPRGDMVLKSDTDQPILATWQYGIGRTSAWTSDLTGQWSSKWLNSQEGVAIIRNTVSWLMGSNISQEITFDATKNGDFTTLKATMPYNSKVKAVTGTIVDNNNKETEATFKAISPEVYESELSNLEEGSYIIALFLEMEDGTTDVKRGGFSIQYPAEYDLRLFANGKEGLEKLISATGGKIIENPQEVFSQQSRNVYTDKSLTIPLIIVALLLFLMDIAFRRFTLISSKAETLLTHRPKKTNQPKPVPTQPATTQKAVAQNAPPQPAPPQSTTAQLLKSKNNRNIRP